ncbi:ATP-binding protein [Pseudomonas sp. CAU 1711]|uniref:ATP-binding protein n=1 Tax=Pseudomonas sp. CAU 1711 TaxID=3140356 RepID=UPI00326017FB
MESTPPQLLTALLQQMELGVLVLDADLRIEYWNAYVEQRSGQSLDRLRGASLLKAFPAAASPYFTQLLECVRQGEGTSLWHSGLALLPLQPGEDAALQSIMLAPFEVPNGERFCALVLFDGGLIALANHRLEEEMAALSARQAEQDQVLRQLDAASSQLLQSEKMAAIGQLAAGVAHEINNPVGYVFSNLKTLGGYVHDLLRIIDAVDSVETLEELRQLKRSLEYDYIRSDAAVLINESEEGIDRVKRIIGALKDFSRTDEEEFRLADLHHGLDTTLNVVNNELKYKAEVVREYGELPEVECIPSQINQVLMNLLVNAAQALEEFGRIVVRTGCEGGWVWVEVEDSGHGIPPELLKRIFEPFFTTKPVGKGTGLGLALSYNIVQKHHGRLEVESTVGRGSRFRLWLPLQQPATEQGEA